MESEKRKFKDLRVIDLRNELSKRSLDTTGLKPVLAERLKKALESEAEDLDLDTYEFLTSEELTTNDSEKVLESSVSREQDGKPQESEVSEVKVDESVLFTEDSSAQKAKVDESVIATEDSSTQQENLDDCVLVTDDDEDSAAQETKENEVVEIKDIDDVKNSTLSVGEKIKLSGAARKRYKWLVSQGHPIGHETKWLAAHPTLEIFEAMKNNLRDTSSGQLGSTLESKEKRETVHEGDNSSAKKLTDSFKQATSSVPIGILSTNYPNQSLTTEQMLVVQKCVMDRILEQANKDLKPQFSGCNFKRGWMLFDCSNRSTAEWLKGIVVNDLQPWKDASLKAMEASDIPSLHVIKGYFPNSAEKTTEAILGYVAAQNDGLEAQKWGVIRRETEGSGVLITLSIDHSAAEQLQKCSFKIHYQFGTVQLKSKGSLREDYVESRRKRKVSTAAEGQAAGIKVAPQTQPSAEKPTITKRQRLRWRQKQKKKIAATTAVETLVVDSAKQKNKATSLAVPSSSPRAPGPRIESNSRAMNSMFAEARRRSKSNGEGSRSSRKPPIRSMPNDRRGAPVVGVSRKPHNQYSRSRSRSPIAPSPPRFFNQASSQRECVNMATMSNNMRPYSHGEANNYSRNYGNQSNRSDMWSERRIIDNYAESRSDYRASGASGASVSREASLRALGSQGMRGHDEEQFNNFSRRRQENSSRETTRYPDIYYKNRPY